MSNLHGEISRVRQEIAYQRSYLLQLEETLSRLCRQQEQQNVMMEQEKRKQLLQE